MAYDDNDTSCILCREDSYGYLFCRSCYYKYKNKKILVSIENCEDFEIVDNDAIGDNTACIVCGNDSYGHLFCRDCYREHKNKTIYLSVKNCHDVKIIEPPFTTGSTIPGNSIFEDSKNKRAEDGHTVRSQQEVLIDNTLYAAGIPHAYEKPLPYTKLNGKPIVPDWFIPVKNTTKGIYIEYWGIKNKKSYDINRADKEKIYTQENIPVIHIEADETANIQQLSQKLIMQLNELALRYYGMSHFIE